MRHFRFASLDRRENSNNGGANAAYGEGSDGDSSSVSGGSEQVKLRKYCRYGTFAWSRELSSDNRPKLADLENTFFGKRVTVPSSQVGLATPSPEEALHHNQLQVQQPVGILKSSSTSSSLISPQLSQEQSYQSGSLEEAAKPLAAVSSSTSYNEMRNDSLGKVGRTATVPVPKPTRLSLNVSPRSSRHGSRGSFLRGYAYLTNISCFKFKTKIHM